MLKLKPSPFLIHANLDAEARWAGGALPQSVAVRVSHYAALVSALAPDDAEVLVWAPAAIDAARILLPVTMHVGAPPRADLAWASAGAKAANDRRFAVALAAELGVGIVGARTIVSADEIEIAGRWVTKAPWTSAGRDRCHGEGPPNAEHQARIRRLIAKFGALVLEPWLERTLDLGVCAMVGPDGTVTAEAPHGLVTDARGTFLGIDLAPPALDERARVQLDSFVAAAGHRLAATGYTGPIAVDAFVAGGRLCVCEINARYSFGWIARALHRRFGTTRLGFTTPPTGARLLVAPGEDGVVAWAQ